MLWRARRNEFATKSIGFNNLRARLQILVMQIADQVGLREVQLVIAAIDEDSPSA